MISAVLVARGVSFRVGGTSLVKNVDLLGSEGEVVALVGPNGAGKSTLIGLLSGDLKLAGGTVTINDVDVAAAAPLELALARAVMRQGSPSNVPFTVLSVVEMGRHPHRSGIDTSKDRDQQAVRSALERTDTAHLAGRIFATLSGGEQTRVVMARILAQSTPLVLLDEPTTALDVGHQEQILTEMRHLAEESICVVAVLHDLNAAAYYADRILIMNEGSIQAEGSPADVLSADLLSDIYRQTMTVVEHPTRGCPLVLTT